MYFLLLFGYLCLDQVHNSLNYSGIFDFLCCWLFSHWVEIVLSWHQEHKHGPGSVYSGPAEGLGFNSLALKDRSSAIRCLCFISHGKPLLFLLSKLLWKRTVKWHSSHWLDTRIVSAQIDVHCKAKSLLHFPLSVEITNGLIHRSEVLCLSLSLQCNNSRSQVHLKPSVSTPLRDPSLWDIERMCSNLFCVKVCLFPPKSCQKLQACVISS